MNIHELDLFDCPVCHGPGLLEEEEGWCLYVSCLDCGCHTAEIPYRSPKKATEDTAEVDTIDDSQAPTEEPTEAPQAEDETL